MEGYGGDALTRFRADLGMIGLWFVPGFTPDHLLGLRQVHGR
jgi:hypothetical protein